MRNPSFVDMTGVDSSKAAVGIGAAPFRAFEMTGKDKCPNGTPFVQHVQGQGQRLAISTTSSDAMFGPVTLAWQEIEKSQVI